jgi:hypothetical protein
MPSDHDKLTATLNDLRAELAKVGELDPQERDRIRTALAEIQAALETKQSPTAVPAGSSGLIDRLGDAALRLEESHPALSSAIGNLAGMLGQMGF